MTYEEGEKLAKDHNLLFLETSAKSSYNVEESFNSSAQMIVTNMEKNKITLEEKVCGELYEKIFHLFFRRESISLNRE